MLKIFQQKDYKDEIQLVFALKKQKKDAQSYLYEKFAPKMLALCMRYLKDQMLAEDIMIEGFMKIFTKIDSYKGEGSFEGWMKRIMVNECLMKFRGPKVYWVATEEYESEFSIEAFTSLEAEELHKMISDLPIGYRTVFNMYVVEGYSHIEIAENLGISEGTSKSQLSRAKAILREQIEKELNTVSRVK